MIPDEYEIDEDDEEEEVKEVAHFGTDEIPNEAISTNGREKDLLIEEQQKVI